ncbi:Phosphate transport regulator (distant of PhoU) [Serinicoccus hydrothermalis]|uniref:Phosphate transport regulator (Distant of PhoU) n=1 Tax=Serinicoccus hydrothermalis TaxID=1758689 RepID=A0A1B1N8Y7_9MICO|nr:DUF47 family protein [Serinicoccus hydrothermalis]ANS77871.1 Phosphate transport regulator (distant of PhoU) [Serinicoccus hydrothermalis]
MRLSRVLNRRPDRALVDLLVAQVGSAIAGVQVARQAVTQKLTPEQARPLMAEVEHEGDRRRSATVTRLANAFANPIDREDLFRLSRSIDDILDNLQDFVRELDLFAVTPDPGLDTVLQAVGEGLADLEVAISAIADNPLQIRARSLAVRKNEIRRRYQVAVAETLSGAPDETTLKNRELLRRLDVVGLRLGEAADALADGAVKRSH